MIVTLVKRQFFFESITTFPQTSMSCLNSICSTHFNRNMKNDMKNKTIELCEKLKNIFKYVVRLTINFLVFSLEFFFKRCEIKKIYKKINK